MNRFILFFCLVTPLLSGCSSAYKSNKFLIPEKKIARGSSVLISTPTNGHYGHIKYFNSGEMTAEAIKTAFLKKTNKVDITTDCNGKACIDQIDPNEYSYYVEPIIHHWEDRATEWSGRKDKITIQLITYVTKTKKEIANITYLAKSKWATLGGDHPQDLLEVPSDQYAEFIFK